MAARDFHELLQEATGQYDLLSAQLDQLRAENKLLQAQLFDGGQATVKPRSFVSFEELRLQAIAGQERDTSRAAPPRPKPIRLVANGGGPDLQPNSEEATPRPAETGKLPGPADPGGNCGGSTPRPAASAAAQATELQAPVPATPPAEPQPEEETVSAPGKLDSGVGDSPSQGNPRVSEGSWLSGGQRVDNRWLNKLYKQQIVHKGIVPRGQAKISIYQRIERDVRFDLACFTAILGNLLYLGVQTDFMVKVQVARLAGDDRVLGRSFWLAGDAVFCAFFLTELLIRALAKGSRFYRGGDRLWNLFDVVIVASSIMEVCTDLLGYSMSMGISVLRTLRVIRIFRVLRVARSLSVVRNIKTMLHALTGCFSSFVSALCMLFVVMFIFCLAFLEGVNSHLATQAHISGTTRAMLKHYGSLGGTLWTLLAAVTGGHDWDDVAHPIRSMGPIYTVFFLAYLLCMLLGLLNILNGIFVNAALQSSAMDRELAMDAVMQKQEALTKELVSMFLEADRDHTGQLSWHEFQIYLMDESIKAYFMALDLDMSSAKKIFELMDKDNSGHVGLQEFVEGCIQLKGGAKMVDLCLMQRELGETKRQVRRIEQTVANTRSASLIAGVDSDGYGAGLGPHQQLSAGHLQPRVGL